MRQAAMTDFRRDILFEDMPEVINEMDGSTIAFVAFDPELGKIGYEEKVCKDA